VDTLVLDPTYQPIGWVPWQRAITLFFQRKVEIVDEYDRTIRSVRHEMQVPSVIRFLTGPRVTRRAIKFSRVNIYSRDGGRCQFCGIKVTLSEFTYDHVVPRAQGGQTSWTNVVTSCVPCNQWKGNRTPTQAGMTLLNEPVRPKKLPDHRFRFTWKAGMPSSWQQWIGSFPERHVDTV
jgi:5-methylcytosine-specific restriction endonuclease McrA